MIGYTLGIRISNNIDITSVIKVILRKTGRKNNFFTIIDGKNYENDDITDYIIKLNTDTVNGTSNVGIIYNFEFLSQISQNKLLKCIEDNKTDLHIFIYKDEVNIIPTIKSRLLRFNVDYNSENKPLDYKKDDCELDIENSRIYHNIYDLCMQNQFKDAYIIFKTKIKDIGIDDVKIVQEILLQSLKEGKNYKMFKKIQEYEYQTKKNVDLGLLCDAMFSTLLDLS